MDYVYGKYKKYTVKSAMVLDNLYIYFEKFAEKNEITVEDLDSAFDNIRRPSNENSY